jgi:hypothetical protein
MVFPDDKATQFQLYACSVRLDVQPIIEYFGHRNINYYVSLVSFGKCFNCGLYRYLTYNYDLSDSVL